jgi:SNF2 family DNA or RNA helicase
LEFELSGQDTLPIEIRLWLADLTGKHVSNWDTIFMVASTLFLSRLDDFIALRNKFGNFELHYDDFFSNLIDKFSADRVRLSEVKNDLKIRIPDEEVVLRLRESGFLRWNSQTEDQLRDIGRLSFLPNGANFSVPGAGKTNTLLAVHAIAKLENPGLKLLVACPKNAMVAWDEEVAMCFGRENRVLRLEGSKSAISRILENEPEFTMVSYQRLKGARKDIESYMRRQSVHLVLDESHRIKAGLKSQQGEAAILLADYAARRDILSGTPMPQGFSDLQAQFQFLWPNQPNFFSISETDSPEVQIEKANKDIRPYFVRTTKRELGLPKPIIRPIPVQMSNFQRETYGLLRDESARYIARLDPQDKSDMRAIGKQVMRLLQFCSDPALLYDRLPAKFRHGELEKRLEVLTKETPTKIVMLDRLVQESLSTPGAKIVIWSMFVDQIESIAKRYSVFGSTTIHGGIQTGADDDMTFREARIKHFKTSSDCRILVANPAACGEGISLHKEAHHAIYFDRSFNAAHFLQSIDRIHRRGLPEGIETRIDILSLSDTIEDAVMRRLSDKIKKLQQLLDDQDLSAMVFDPEDVQEFDEEDFTSSDLQAVMSSLVS